MAVTRTPAELLEQLRAAMATHDLEALMECFADDYASEQPIHPARRFQGRDQARSNWAGMFGEIPDFNVDVLRSTIDGDTIWLEWRWTGTPRNGPPLDEIGMSVFGVRHGRLAWGRLYIEPIERDGGDVAAQMRDRLGAD
jgi:ketosteroid isomerase-like protein